MCYTEQGEYRIIYRCGRCRKKMPFFSTRKFRINANKNKLDIWLIYQCSKCRHTLNIPLFERISPQKIPSNLYALFLDNDEDLATKYASDRAFLKSKHFQVE